MIEMYMPRNTIMYWGANKISDHNRSSMSISIQQIENSARMVDGTMRKHVIAQKRTYSMSWDMFPSDDAGPVDGGKGGEWMLNFYRDNTGPITVTFHYDGSDQTKTVFFSNFSYEIIKRGAQGRDLVNISCDLEEV